MALSQKTKARRLDKQEIIKTDELESRNIYEHETQKGNDASIQEDKGTSLLFYEIFLISTLNGIHLVLHHRQDSGPHDQQWIHNAYRS